MAIARWVTKDGADPKMGVLSPSIFDKVDCLLWVQMPFADDVRKYTFASLDNLVNKKGEVVTKHPYIPTEEQQEAMDNFVDAMDLMHAGEKDEEGNRYPWYDTRLSYNPAIHRTKQALFHSAVVQDLASNPLPPPHPELLKYFEPPKKVLKRARDALEECKASFKVKQVPKKVARQRKDGHVRARDDDDEMLLLDAKPPRRTASQIQAQTTPSKKPITADSDTDDSDSDQPPGDEQKKNGQALPTPARSMSPPADPGRAPGRIIGTTYPLNDFQKNISQGDVVSKAVEDLGFVIKEIVMKPFSSRRHDELLECMTAFRDIALKEDEIDAWNEFIQDLKLACFSDPGNKEFWALVQKQGQSMSLISKPEAAKNGGISAIPESDAEAFLQ
jgi:ATP-dependent DNA helicase 2 subunit 2